MLMQTGFYKHYSVMLLAGNINNVMYWLYCGCIIIGWGRAAPWLFGTNGGVAPAVLPMTHSPNGEAVVCNI